MFGSGGAFGSGGGGTNNNNTSGFGGFGQSSQNKPTGFGGGTGAFGSTATGGGGFGSGSGIGGFGSTTGATTGGFGSTSNAFGGSTTGAFGGGSSNAFGGGGGTTTGAFGQQQPAATGSTSSLFGGGGGGAFGSSSTVGGGGAFGVGATGTARAQFEPVTEISTTGKKDSFRHICFMNAYKAFSPEELRLEDYEAGRKKADAPGAVGAGGARTGFGGSTTGFGGTSGTTTGGFGQTSTGFGQTAAGSGGGGGGFGQTLGGFGSGGGFSQQQPASASVGGGFGLNKPAAAATGGFGSTTGGGFGSTTTGFGQPAAAGTGSIFGASKPSAFGQPATGTATGGFGSTFGGTAAGTGTTGFGGGTGGGFGQTSTGFGQTANTGSGGLFGQTSTAATGGFGSSGTGGAFGAKPAFGATNTTTTGFGGSAAAQPATTGGFGQTTGGFGQTSTGGFGQTTGGFGQTANTTGSTGGGLFGQTANTTTSTGGGLFGAKPAGAATGGGLFGQSTAAPATGGLFGQPAAAPAASGGLFGQPAAAPATGGLFGSTGTTNTGGGGLFGAKPAAPATGGLFGSAPAAGTQTGTATGGGGLFGSSGGGGGGLFGSNTTGATGTAATGGGGGLFGSSAAAPTTGGTGLFGSSAGTGGGGLFGNSAAPAAGASTGLFGFGGQAAQQQPAQQPSMFGMAAQQQQQQPQYAVQIDKQPYGASSLFDTTRLAGARLAGGGSGAAAGGSSHLTATPLRAVPAPRGADPERDLQLLKKRGLNLHSLLSSSPHVGSGGSAGGSGMSRLRARGFAAPSTIKKLVPNSTGLASAGFSSPAPQAPHSSVKRLTIAPKSGVGAAGPLSTMATPAASASKPPPPSFSSMLGTPPQMKSVWANTPLAQSNASTAGRTPAASRHVAASVAAELADGFGDDVEDAGAAADGAAEETGADGAVEDEAIEPGEYWMSPSLADLRALSTLQLRAVKDFTVGRKNVGQVCFRRAVDLTTVGSLDAIAGKVVLFDDRVCTVYPDESNKPARGQGLNVPADISLEHCWPVDRATGEAITNMDDPRVRKHIKRLRNIEETEFLTFSDGTWNFRVQHFSRYGLDDNEASSDEEEKEDAVAASTLTQDFGNATAQHAPQVAQQSQLDNGSRAVADVPSPSSTVNNKNNTQRPPRQLLLGGRHAEALRRGPVMRASLFATSADDASQQQQQQQQQPATTSSFGRIHTQSPAIPVTLPQQHQQAQLRSKPARSQPRRRNDNASQMSSAAEGAPSVAALDLPPPSKFLRINETRIARELLSAPQPYAQSLTHGRSGLGADAGLMMARSFRVAFGFQGQLVYLQGSSLSNDHMDDDDDDNASSKRGRGATSVVVVDSIARHLHAAPGCLEPLAVAAGDDDIEGIRQRHLDTVRAQYRHARIAPQASPESALCPSLSFSPETTIASVLNEFSRNDDDDNCGSNLRTENERRILELASVLFDEPEETVMDGGNDDVAACQRVLSVRRRQALTKWLMSAVKDSVNRDLVLASASPSPAAASVFALMSGHRIDAACLAATSHRDYRLAMLVAQSGAGAVGGGGNDKQMRDLVCAQLERINKDDPSLAPAYRRVYELIGGRVSDASASLDWKRAFALGLWFAQSPADRISDAVSMYENGALLQQPSSTRSAPPLPAWLFQGCGGDDCRRRLSTLTLSEISASTSSGSIGAKRAAARAADLHRRGVWDPVFQLLKLFSEPAYPLERALLSESFSAARGDSRLSALLAWLLATIRQCRGFEDAKSSNSAAAAVVVDSLAYDRLLTGWALQLESLGLWHWACFVLLQLSSSPAHKAHAIRALLDRSIPTSLPTTALSPAAAADLLPLCATTSQAIDMVDDDRIEEQLRFVLDDLCLPRQWLYDAMATRSRYDRDWVDVRCNGGGGSADIEMTNSADHPVLAAAQRQFTASGRPIVRSYFDQFATPPPQQQQQKHPMAVNVPHNIDMSTDTCRAAATLRHVVWLLSARQLSAAHTVVLQRIAPDAILRGDYHLLSRVLSYLDPALSSDSSVSSSGAAVVVVPHDEWATGGHVYQAFLAAVEGLPTVLQRIASITTETPFELVQELQRIYYEMRSLLAALPSLAARFDALPGSLGFYDGFGTEACWYSPEESRVLRVKYSVAVSDMASIISGFVQSLECHAATTTTTMEAPIGDSLVSLSPNAACTRADSVALPLAQDVRILRTLQMARTCFDSLVASELEA